VWLAAAVLGLAAATTAAGEELAPFLAAHQKASTHAQQSQWPAAAKAYGAFASERPGDPAAPLAAILQGMILRRELKQPDEARAAFETAARAPDTPFGRHLQGVARIWLAWLAMEPIDAALRRYWVDRVEYPEKLETLAERKLLRPEQLVDPWGKPWVYRAGPLAIAPDVARQSYTLGSGSLEGHSRQFARFLKASAEFPARFQLRAIGGVKPLAALIAQTGSTSKPVHVAEGETIGSATLIRLTREGGIVVGGGFVAVLVK